MPRRCGTLLAVFTYERRHRLVKRYARPRAAIQNYGRDVLEEITTHQLHELAQPFLMAGTTSAAARGPVLRLLREVFPDTPTDAISINTSVTTQDGRAKTGDAVFVESAGVGGLRAGRLEVSFTITRADGEEWFSIISLWETGPRVDPVVRDFSLRGQSEVLVRTTDIVCPLTHRTSSSDASVYVPLWCR